MKIRNLFAVAITLLSLGMFVACNSDEEYDQTFANNEKILKSEFAKSTIAPLNTIPENVRIGASEEELATFSKLSSVFYVDYSFVSKSFYRDNKDVVLYNLNLLYEEYAQKKQTPVYFTVLSFTSQHSRLKPVLVDNLMITEQGPNRVAIASYFGSIPSYALINHIELCPDSCGNYQIDPTSIVRTFIHPDNACYNGTNEWQISNNILSVSANGYLYTSSNPNSHATIGPSSFNKDVRFPDC